MNDQLARKNCLLIMQKRFYSFETFLKNELYAKGFKVEVANDEYPLGIFGRIMGKVQFPLIFITTYRYITKNFLDKNNYDIVLIIKGRGISKRLIEKMKQSVPKIIGYNWDTFKYNRSPLKWFKYATKFYTFDYVDAGQFGIPVVELFSSLTQTSEVKNIRYEVSAVGRNYYGRLKYIDQVMQIIKPAKFYIHLYENNIFDFILNFLRNPGLYAKYKKNISFHPLSDLDYYEAIKSSEFTVDYAENSQSGITMRCFEALSLKTRIITNNYHLSKSSYFNDTNSVIFSPSSQPNDLITKYNACKASTLNSNNRDIGCFIQDLLS
jgi:hypothetical protein